MSRQSLDRVVKREPAPKRNKYGARKTVLYGITFDSKAEGDYYLLLLSKQQRGEIQAFRCQPRYRLQDGFKKNGQTYRPIDYIADFEVLNLDGSKMVIDVKPSERFKTEVYKLKRKLFERKYPDLTIKEVYKDGVWDVR